MIGNKRGNDGENIACRFIEKKGYTVIERNYRSQYGEVDIIARYGDFIVFAEVKLRKKNSRVSGKEAVSASKQRKIISTSALYLQDNPTLLQPRFDVICVTDCENGEYITEHIENAFDTQSMFL